MVMDQYRIPNDMLCMRTKFVVVVRAERLCYFYGEIEFIDEGEEVKTKNINNRS